MGQGRSPTPALGAPIADLRPREPHRSSGISLAWLDFASPFPILESAGDSRTGCPAWLAGWQAERGELLLVELEDLDRERRQRVVEMIADARERAFYGDDLGGLVECVGGLGVGSAEADELSGLGQFGAGKV